MICRVLGVTLGLLLLMQLVPEAVAEDRVLLGLEVVKLTDAWRSKLGCEGDGALVISVDEGSPAELAGLEEGDVIKSVDGEAVRSPGGLAKLVEGKKLGEVMKLDVFRKDKAISIEVKPKSGPEPRIMPKLPRQVRKYYYVLGGEPQLWIGVGVEKVTGQLAKHFGVEKGLLVNEVLDGTPAAEAGLKAGDIITKADKVVLEEPSDLREVIAGKEARQTVKLEVVREGKKMTVETKIDKNPSAFTPLEDITSWFHKEFRLPSPPPAGDMEEMRREMKELRKELNKLREMIQEKKKKPNPVTEEAI